MTATGFPPGARERTPWQVFHGWPRSVRWTAYALVLLVLMLVAALVLGVVLVRRPFPQVEGTIDVPA